MDKHTKKIYQAIHARRAELDLQIEKARKDSGDSNTYELVIRKNELTTLLTTLTRIFDE